MKPGPMPGHHCSPTVGQPCCLGKKTPNLAKGLRHSNWFKQPNSLFWMVMGVDTRPGCVAAILSEGARLRMKQTWGGAALRVAS